LRRGLRLQRKQEEKASDQPSLNNSGLSLLANILTLQEIAPQGLHIDAPSRPPRTECGFNPTWATATHLPPSTERCQEHHDLRTLACNSIWSGPSNPTHHHLSTALNQFGHIYCHVTSSSATKSDSGSAAHEGWSSQRQMLSVHCHNGSVYNETLHPLYAHEPF